MTLLARREIENVKKISRKSNEKDKKIRKKDVVRVCSRKTRVCLNKITKKTNKFKLKQINYNQLL